MYLYVFFSVTDGHENLRSCRPDLSRDVSVSDISLFFYRTARRMWSRRK